MFAPEVIRTQTNAVESRIGKPAPRHAIFVSRRVAGVAADLPNTLQQPTGSEAMGRFPVRQPAGVPTPGGSQDFSAIRLFAPDGARAFHASSPLARPSLSLIREPGIREPGITEPGLIVGAANDPLEHEADRVAEQVMRIPDPAFSSATAPPSLSRKSASGGENDAHMRRIGSAERVPAGSGSGVAGLVHEVLRSPGQPLDASTRGFMEPRFGRDFSNVRVHSSSSAERSARDVNAQAYTSGHDIAFGAGRFAPGTQQGRRLLAHELAHVVQQSGSGHALGGGSPVSLQRTPTKVGLPFVGGGLGILSNHSAVTFAPWGALDMSGVLASITFFPGGSGGDVNISAGTKGIARIYMSMHILEDNTFKNDSSDQAFHVDWNVAAARDGTLTIDPNAKLFSDEGPTSSTVGASLTSINPSPPGTDYVRINPIVSSGGGSGSLTPFGIGATKNAPGAWVTAPFSLNLHVKDIQPPEAKVTISSVEKLESTDVLFPPPRNNVGQDKVSDPQEQNLIRWYRGLNDQTRKQIEAGATPITLEGHASTTGDAVSNRELSNRRMDHVKTILGQFAGNRAVFQTRSIGAYEAKTSGEIQDERKVVVSVWEGTAAAAAPSGGKAP
jgi:hypothetical protein